MRDMIKYTDIRVEINRPDVLNLMGCLQDNPIYEQVLEEYNEIKDTILSLGEPQALFLFGQMPRQIASEDVPEGAEVIFSLLTEGDKISRYSTQMFKEGDYLKGMIADAASGAYLFALEDAVEKLFRMECADRGIGIQKRLEAPEDIPMTAQKVIYDVCNAKEELGMEISSGYMYYPVKSSGKILIPSKDPRLFHVQHDCSKCTAANCKMRKVK